MHIVILVLFLTSFNPFVSCFSCSDLSQKDQCSQLEGCLWNSTSSNCEGTFNPLCLPPVCYYIDNSTQAATPAGTPADPLSTLTDGLIKLANSNASLIIMNQKNNTLVDMISARNISTNIIIKPLILGNYYQIRSSKILSTVTPFTVSGQLTIIEAIFNYTSSTYGMLFSLTNGTLTFQRVIMQISGQPAYYVVYIGRYPSSKFYYDGGQVSTISARFSFLTGFAFFKNVKVINFISTFVSLSSATVIVENCYFSGGQGYGQDYLFYIDNNANFSMSGCLFEQGNYTGSMMSVIGNANITIQRTIFRGITSTVPIINSLQNNLLIPSFIPFPLTILDCVFENMTVKSIIQITQMNIEVSLINTTMNNIRKISDIYMPSYLRFNNAFDYTLGVCCAMRMNGTLNIISSKFTNINSTCINLYQSKLIVNSTVFNNSGIGIEKSSLAVDSLENLDIASGIVWILINQPSFSISIDSSKFIKNTLLSMQGGAIRLIGPKQIQFSLTSNEFIENIAYYGGAIYIDNPLLLFKSTQNIFTGNSAFEGGAIYKKPYSLVQKPFFPSFIIEGNNYTGNTAIRAGGAVHSNGDSLQISQGRFVDNTARIGGGLYAINIDSHNTDTPLSLSGVVFANNIASQFGSCIVTFSNLKEDKCVFENNTDPLNQPVISQRLSYFLFSFYDVIIDKEIYGYDDLSAWTTNTSRTKLAFTLNTAQSLSNKLEIKHKSGTEIKQILKIEAYDEHDQLLSFAGKDDQILVQITEIQHNISNFQAYLKSSPLILSFTQGQIFVKTPLRIFGETNSKATLNFKSLNTANNILYETNFIMDQNIQISFIPCEIGDIYDASSKSCNPCPSGTYSLDDPYQSPICRTCVDNAECLGGSKIAPLPGYWRFDTGTALIMKCHDETTCKGGYVDEIYYPQGVCAPFHEGKLCSKCAPNYAKFGSSETCFGCQSTLYYLKLVGFFGLYIMGIMLNFKYASQKDKISSGTLQDKGVSEQPLANDELRFNILKIIISFIQISSIVVQYNFGWPKQALEIVQTTNKIMPVGQDAFSIDCFITLILGTNDYTHFIKLIVAAVRPFIVWILIISGYNIYKAIRERNPKKLHFYRGTKQLILLLIIAFVDQPHIILIALETFKCQTYENSQGSVMFMFKDSQVECWTNMHIAWSVIAGMIFVIWGMILPILLLRRIQRIHKIDKGSRSEDYFKCRYIMGCMKPRWYYWEFVSLLRRSLVIIVFVSQSLLSDLTQISLILIIFWCFAGIFGRVKPYRVEILNKLELSSLIALMVMTYTGAYFIDEKTPDTSKWNILIIAMIVANISFYLLSVYYFVKSYLQKSPSRSKKAISEVETNQEIQSEKKTSFLSLRSPAPSFEGQAIEDILQSLEIELDEHENGRLKKQESPKTFFALSSISSEPDLNSEGNKTANHKIMKSILNLKDLEPVFSIDSEYDALQTGHHSTIVTTHRSPTLMRKKSKVDDYEYQISSQRSNQIQDLRPMQNSKPLTEEAVKFSIPNEHEGIKTPKYEVKTKTYLNNDKKKPTDN